VSELHVKTGPAAGLRVTVEGEVILGRKGADLDLDDQQVSRRHAAVRDDGRSVEIEDLGSRNGTWLDGRRVAGTVTIDTDTDLQIGDTTIAIVGVTREPDRRAAPPLTPSTPFAPSSSRRASGVATRLYGPAALTFAVILFTAIALVVYFAAR
jgi:pSer/pThr/pTyr-binding forkhead associated (FHA) protein